MLILYALYFMLYILGFNIKNNRLIIKDKII